MLAPTHRALAVTAATGVSVAASAPLATAVVIAWAAWVTARLPDRMERWFHAPHRWWTHFLLTTITAGTLFGLLIYGIGWVAAAGLAKLLGPGSGDVIAVALQAALGMGVLCAIGGIVGATSHTLADACTKSGSPLLWPFIRRPLWLMPEDWRTSTGRVVHDPATGMNIRTREMTRGERHWLHGAWIVTGLLIASRFVPELIAFWRELLDALRTATPAP